MIPRFLIACLGLSVVCSLGAAEEFPTGRLDNWHQWRGPLANGTAPRGNPPVKWDAKTNIRWQVDLPGKGSATPIIWGNRIFVLTAVDTGRKAAAEDIPKPDPKFNKIPDRPNTYHRFLVLCFDRHTGKELWRKVANETVPHEGHHPTHTYAAGSPTTDGKRLYVSFGSYGLYAFDLEGKPLWQRNLGRMETRLGWGEGVSPVIYKDALIVNRDQEGQSYLFVLDPATGKTRWRKERDEVTSWATPLVVEHAGKTQVIVSGTSRVRSYDLASGEVLWECGGQTVNAIPSPLSMAGFIIVMSGYKGSGAYAIPLDASGDISDSDKILWEYHAGTPYVPSPLLTEGRLYFTIGNNPLLTCLEARTGKVLFQRQRLQSIPQLYASPIEAAGRLYFTGRDGTTLVVERGDRVKVLATNRVDDTIDASPVVVGKQLFLRGWKALYCIEEQEP
jgi:outer membrane protein assembly factor BamB